MSRCAAIVHAALRGLISDLFAHASPTLQSSLVEKELVHLGDIIRLAAACKKPDNKGLEPILLPLSNDIEAVSRAKEQFRKDRDWSGHHTVLAEGAPVVGWITVVRSDGRVVLSPI